MDKFMQLPMNDAKGNYSSALANNSFLYFPLNNTINATLSSWTNNTVPIQTKTEGNGHFHTLIIVLMVMIFVIGSIGNSVVCYVFGFKQRKRRSVPETLFLYLGTVDLVASIVNPSLYIYWTVTEYKRWDFGIAGCKILAALAPISVTLSALLILIIAVDRYFIIVHQFGRNYSATRIKFVALGALLISVCLYIPYMLYLEVKRRPCGVYNTSNPGYAYPTVAVLFLQDFGFIAVLIFTNVRIKCNLRHQRFSKFERAFEARRLRSNTRLTRILIAMSCVFCLLVIPRDILQLIFIISWLRPPGVKYTAFLVQCNSLFKVMQTANSCVNVFIYSKMHRKFRIHLMRLICGMFWKQQHNASEFDASEQAMPRWKMRLLKFREGDDTPTDSPMLLRACGAEVTANGAASRLKESPLTRRLNNSPLDNRERLRSSTLSTQMMEKSQTMPILHSNIYDNN